MTLAIRVDWQSAAVHADRERIEAGDDVRSSEDVLRRCSRVQVFKHDTKRHDAVSRSQKTALGGHTGACLVVIAEERLTSVAILKRSGVTNSVDPT